MSHGILDDWLENQIGDVYVEHFGVDANVGSESILEPNALDLEISVQKLDLLLECHFHRTGVFECKAQEVAETRDHLAGGFSVPAQQRRDRMQGIEKEVRMDLHLQRFQLRLHQLGAKLRSLQLVLAITVVVVERVAQQQDEPVNEHPAIEVVVKKVEDAERRDLRSVRAEHHEKDKVQRDQSAGQHNTEEKMQQRPSHPVAPLDAETPYQPENQRSGERPDVTR